MVIFVLGYALLKLKYMLYHEQWQLNTQTVMAEKSQLTLPLNFSDFQNVSIGL
jgi:hypothetical protein